MTIESKTVLSEVTVVERKNFRDNSRFIQLSKISHTLVKHVTKRGWIVCALSVFFGVLAVSFGWIEFAVLGFSAILTCVFASLMLLGSLNYRVCVELEKDRVVVGENALAHVTIENPRARRLFGVRVEVPCGDTAIDIAVSRIAKNHAFREIMTIPTMKRQIVTIGPARSVKSDPFALVRRVIVWEKQTRLFVHPKTREIPSASSGFVRDLEGVPTKDLTSSDISFHAVRQYSRGDDRRHIHWKSTAKTGMYMVRQFEETRRSHMTLLLPLESSHYSCEAEFELAVSTVASLGLKALKDARNFSLIVGSSRHAGALRTRRLSLLDTRTRTGLLDDLTRVNPVAHSMTLGEMCSLAAHETFTHSLSLVFLLCGSGIPFAHIMKSASSFATDVHVVVLLCKEGSAFRIQKFDRFSVVTISQLDDVFSLFVASRRVDG